ncbi:uncharacterized protein PAC_15532 [Phialocephala subalpina]|uniref:Uncharacterized protein n=1 Tax=Phialocephala subalpina TaxID=576137 RepID=A0A1L7XKR8_9HELO|nr:uncharacterized protein PAC_15532 [Phialocephala subalpina]
MKTTALTTLLGLGATALAACSRQGSHKESSLNARSSTCLTWRNEDYCQECTDDFSSGNRHIDIWTGSSSVNGGQEQINCEDSLTPSGNVVIVRSPDGGYAVDTAPLYHKGTSNPCRTNHLYPDAKAHTYCP